MRDLLLAAIGAAALSLPAFAQTPPASPDQALRIALNEDADMLDPARSITRKSSETCMQGR